MKNLIIKTLLLTVMACNAYAQDTPTHWIHGLGESSTIWHNYAPLFQQERRMDSRTPSYLDNDNNGIASASTTLASRMPANTNNILIGHSMGGLVARDYERTFGVAGVRGIVTVTSPNQGATVANKIINGDAQTIINRGVDDLIAGPEADGKVLIGLLLSSSLSGIPSNITEKIVNKNVDKFLRENLFSKVSNLLPLNTTPTLQDLQTGSAYLTQLNRRPATVPVVNIICEENDHAALRIANSALAPPEEAPLNQYDDGSLVEVADRLRQIYKGRRLFYDAAKFANPLAYGSLNRLANKWQRGEDYLGSVYEADYNTLIGATRSVPVIKQVSVRVCTSTCSDGQMRIARNMCPAPPESACHYETQNITTYQIVTTASDGLLPNWTQRMPGISDGNVYTAVGVNHLEVGNHPSIYLRYVDVFNRPDRLGIPPR